MVAQNPGDVWEWYADRDLQVRAAMRLNKTAGSCALLYRTDERASWRELESWDWLDASLVDSVQFSRDGKKLYLIDPKGSNTAQGVCLDLETGARTVVEHDDEYDVGGFTHDAYGNVWAVDILKERWVMRGLTPEYEKLVRAIQRVDSGNLISAGCSALRGEGPDKQKWILSFKHDDHSHTYYFFDAQIGRAIFLFSARPELDQYSLAHMKPIVFKSRDGLTIHGYLTLPRGRETEHLPMILYVHGGPWARDRWGFDSFAQFFANRGYACLQVNFRGSTGYGKDFVNAGNKEWGGKMQDDLVDAVKWAVDQGIADPKRVAIYGMSYGGYAALVGATFTPDIFCCAVDYVGISNLVSFFQTMPSYWKMVSKFWVLRVGDPETEEEFLRSRSPLFKIDAIKIPMLIIQGANDPRVKKAESDQIVAAMRAKRLDVEYIVFDDEGHGATGQKNNIMAAKAMEKFFAKHL